MAGRLERPERNAPIAPAAPVNTPNAARILLPSQRFGAEIIDTAPRIELPALTQGEIRSFRASHDPTPQTKTYVGINRRLTFDAQKDGRWLHPEQSTEVWSLSLVVHGAQAIRVHFQNLNLPSGARLFLYAPGKENDAQQVFGKGPFATGEFWSDVFSGEEVRLEYSGDSAGSDGSSNKLFDAVEVSDVYAKNPRSSWGYADSCNLDWACYPAWSQSGQSVAMIWGSDTDGTFACSGVLLNNATNDYSPLFLTANHCFSTGAVAQTARLFWDFASDTCGQVYEPTWKTNTNGASLLATSSAEDSTLLLLNDGAPNDATFSAWNASSASLGSPLTAIHHPSASWRRISFGTVTSDRISSYPDFFGVAWSGGVLEHGSSGGPGFNANHEVIGIVSRGSSSCSNPGGIDFFAPISGAYATLNSAAAGSPLTKGGPDDQYAPNQTRASAASISLNVPQTWLILKNGKDDWFKLHLTAGAQVEVFAQGGLADPVMEYFVGTSTTAHPAGLAPFVYVNSGAATDLYLHLSRPSGYNYLRYSFTVSQVSLPAPQFTSYYGNTISGPYGSYLYAQAVTSGVTSQGWFEFSTDPNFTNVFVEGQTTMVPVPGAPNAPVLLTYMPTDLTPNTTYYWRAVIQNPLGTIRNSINSFTTAVANFKPQWTPNSLQFPDTKPGTTNLLTLGLYDQGNVGFSSIQVTLPQPFTYTTQGCGVGSCNLQITFAPIQVGTYTGNVSVNVHGTVLNIPLQAAATTGVPLPQFDTSDLSFPYVWVGQQQTKTLTLTNAGDGPLKISSFFLFYGTNIIWQQNDCPSNLPAGAACHLYITFKPPWGFNGWANALYLYSNAVTTPEVYITGNGVDVPTWPKRPARGTIPRSSANVAPASRLRTGDCDLLTGKFCR